MINTKLPIGIENFEEIRTEGFYYVDKTSLIIELLNNWGKVNLFTRPRRFGKSLNMSMLECFFSYGAESRIFEGLKIAEERKLCQKYMGKFPVIFITLKGVSSSTYEGAKAMLRSVIGRQAVKFQFLLESERLSSIEKEQYAQLVKIDSTNRQGFSMPDEVLSDGLLILTRVLHRHYGQKVILLIDEYDVPLDKAQQAGYYDEMTGMIRNLFGQALKSNDSLYFAVLTGCMRISKESIFTGLNNLNVFSVTNVLYDAHFGFSDEDVRKMLKYYGHEEKYKAIKEWYDGYRFGNTDVYCPWDVINYVSLLRTEPNASPKAFWINTSSNDIVRKFLQMAKQRTKREMEQLINGEAVVKKINQELTYRDLYKNVENLWSALFATGYLTQRGKTEEEAYWLVIPNQEIRKIFIDQILEWFQEEAQKDTSKLDAFCSAFARGDARAVQEQFCAYLQKTISIRDTGVRKIRKENFYHGILLGLLSHREDWDIDSNAEAGLGYCDIMAEIAEEDTGILIEIKYSETEDMEAACHKALAQMEDKSYEMRFQNRGIKNIIKYGIACRKKECKVTAQSAATHLLHG